MTSWCLPGTPRLNVWRGRASLLGEVWSCGDQLAGCKRCRIARRSGESYGDGAAAIGVEQLRRRRSDTYRLYVLLVVPALTCAGKDASDGKTQV